MKKIKKFEEIKTIKSSELDSWDTKQISDQKKYTGTKNLNKDIGAKMIEVFNNYGFFVMGVGPGDFLGSYHILLEPEKNLREYRVKLGLNDTWENFLDSNGYSEEEFNELDIKEQQQLEKDFNRQGDISDGNMEFSVFLPNGVKDENAAFSDAFEYLKLVQNSIPQMYTDPILEEPRSGGVLNDLPDEFKKFINNKGIKITNENVEDVNTINYRLYKDSKFFYELKEVCDHHNIDYEDLITNLLNIK